MKHHVPEWHPGIAPASGYLCPKPYRYQFEGDMYQRDCGKCARCLAAKKRDIAARAAAESLDADEVVFITLTYRPGEVGAFEWVAKDRQDFMKRVRNRLYLAAEKHVCPDLSRRQRAKLPYDQREAWRDKIAAAVQRVRYFGCGEVGERGTKRNHWHVILFLSGGKTGLSGFRTTPLDTKGDRREHIDLWPHGHVSIECLPTAMHDRLRAIRYCVMYLHKKAQAFTSGGVTRPACVPFRSMKPALGAVHLAKWGREHADAGLPLPSFYKVAGVCYSKGIRKGQTIKNYLAGVVRREVILAYLDRWQERYGARDVPHSDFLKRFWPGYIEPARNPLRRSRMWHRADGSRRIALPASVYERAGSERELFQQMQDQRDAQRVAMLRAFGPRERPDGRSEVQPLTGIYRRLVLSGPSVRGEFVPSFTDGREHGPKLVLKRPEGFKGIIWPGAPSWMRRAP